MQNITVTFNKVENYPHNFRSCIGTGRMRLALHKEYLDALKKVQKDIGFEYIRGHGIFDDDMGIYNEFEHNGEMKTFYNFTYLDMVFDSYLELGIKPFIELGFMPNQLASDKNTVFWWKGNITPPESYDKWNDLITNLFEHLIDRYGLVEVRKWPIEVWNEPNLTNFWKDADQKEYFKLYKETVLTIKNIDELLQVGGPAICGGSDHWIEDFILFCKNEKVPLDFFSRHSYSAEMPEVIPYMTYQELTGVDNILDDFESSNIVLKKHGYDIPHYITEYNTSYRPDNPIHDTAYNAAYLGRVLSEGHKSAEMFSYWTFTDVFEEVGIPNSFLHGGFGLLTFGQIPKPTYHLFHFFSQLKSDVVYTDDNVKVSYDFEKEEGVIVLWNPSTDGKDKKINLNLPINNKSYAQSSIVNEESGNVWNAWRTMGKPRFPSKQELDILRKSSEPLVEIEQITPKDSSIDLKIVLKPNEVRIIKLFNREENKQKYLDQDDNKINPMYSHVD